ncbi:phage tail tape measure protein [Fusobacterium mortiferum]|uniref:phage tail tape measure protein n=1 Tax=Fusobacterium mortiferum TaxID=850 RepID=UPI001F23C24B|nr:phage tail tape measure protein [Fusobacterium mortiferum]MCF2698216.1 phage tail tape measure protein [Fusobacterium mortiferum]
MANNFVLSAVLELKDRFTSTITNARSQFRNLNGEIGGIQNSITKTSNFLTNSIAGVLGGITAGSVVNFLKDSYSGYVDLNEQLIKNAAITGANISEQAILKKQVNDLGASTKFTALEVAKAQMYQAMAGYKTNEILEVTPTLLKLAIATGEDLAATSDMVTDNLSAFGLSVKDAAMFSDILASAANNTNTSVGQLGGAFKYVGTVSTAMGENVKEVAVMLGLAADNGIKAEQAGTALRGIYSRLAKPTEEMYKQFEKTNTKLYDEKGHFLGLRKVIEESRPALEKLTLEQRNQWLATIAGTEGMSIWSAIMNSSEEGIKKVEKAVYQANGALDIFTETMSKTDKQKIDELSSAFDGFKNQIGEALSPVMMRRIEQLTEYLTELSSSDTFSTTNMTLFFEKLDKYVGQTWEALYGDSWLTQLRKLTTFDTFYISDLIKKAWDERPEIELTNKNMTWEDYNKERKEQADKVLKLDLNKETPYLKVMLNDEKTTKKYLDSIYKNDFKAKKNSFNDEYNKFYNFRQNYSNFENKYLSKEKINQLEKTKNNPLSFGSNTSQVKDFNFNIELKVMGLDGVNKEMAEKILKDTMAEVGNTIRNINLSSETQ